MERFHSAFRDLTLQRVSNLVDRIEPVFTLDDVVLPPTAGPAISNCRSCSPCLSRARRMEVRRTAALRPRRHRAAFMARAARARRWPRWASRTGSASQILRIDLSKVVSKYIGDTEKNIARVFDDAQRSGAAILIDEADALLGKRSEVKDAHDRYANIEVAYLLQRMEAYEGLAILTTNMRAESRRRVPSPASFHHRFPATRRRGAREDLAAVPAGGSHELDDAIFASLPGRST